MGEVGSKMQAADGPPPSDFGARPLQANSSPSSDNIARQARDDYDRLHRRNGSPSTAPLRGRSSPPLRHSFVPDRVGTRWEDPHRPSEWASHFMFERGSRRPQRSYQTSPPLRQSPPRRPSPPRLDSYGYDEGPRSPLAQPLHIESPGRHSRRTSDAFESPSYFSNLSWRASESARSQFSVVGVPGLKDAERIRAAAPSTSLDRHPEEADNGKVSYNGLKDVPTGPKRNSGVFQSVPVTFKKLPHIFVSAQHLPVQRSTLQHLFRALRKSVERESDIRFDELGWYISFEDNADGRASMQECFRTKDRMKLFGQYTIRMELFPHGSQAPIVAPEGDLVPVPMFHVFPEPNVAIQATSSHVTPQIVAEIANGFTENGMLPTPNVANVHHAVNTASAIARLIQENPSPILPSMEAFQRRQSSPLRLPSRLDKEDSSSCISGPTGSDTSRTKRLKCHVCKAIDPFDSDVLVNCSSCPRRYHRRCHVRPTIPVDLEVGHAWQCRRCVKKQIQPKSRLKSSSPAVSRAEDRRSSDEPPSKRQCFDAGESAEVPMSNFLNGISDQVKIGELDTYQVANGVEQPLHNESHQYRMLHGSGPNSDETHFQEADDLVAKSFAPPTAALTPFPGTVPTAKRSTFVRTKLPRPNPASDQQVTILQSSASNQQNAKPIAATDHSMVPEVNGTSEVVSKSLDPRRKLTRWNDNVVQKLAMPVNRELVSEHHETLPNENMIADGEAEYNYIPELSARTEVPESPVEMRNANANSTSTEEDAVTHLKRSADTGGFPLLGLDGIIGLREEPSPRQDRMKLQRMRPGAQKGDRCENCGKKIAYNPSGTNKLCTKCKVAASASGKADKVQPTSVKEVDTPLGASASPRPGDEANYVKHKRTDSSQAPPDVQMEGLASTARVIAEPEPEPKPQESDKMPPLPHLTLPRSAEEIRESEKGIDDENVLDFWTTGAALAEKEETNGIDEDSFADVAAPEQPDEEDVLSDAGSTSSASQADEAPRKAVPKRRSQTRPATSQHDLGDSHERPKGAYEKLIGMALCSVPDHRMRGTDVTQWVAKNIPGYKAGEGKWESSLRATLTLKKEGYMDKPGLWTKIESAGAKKNETCWWELLPGQAEKMLHWDPVLGQPVSPLATASNKSTKVGKENQADGSDEVGRRSPLSPEVLRARRKKQRKRLQQGQAGRTKAVPPSEMTPERSRKLAPPVTRDVNSSSDEEPLLQRKRKVPKSASRVHDSDMADVAESPLSHPVGVSDLEENKIASQAPRMVPPATHHKSEKMVTAQTDAIPLTIKDVIQRDTQNTAYSVKTLFDEYPEYDPKNYFDREAKMSEIKKRPKRKEKFGRFDPTMEMGSPHPVIDYTTANASPERIGRSVLYPWETTEDNIVQCNTLEELFNLPKHPVAIIHDGQLAYRDGTRNEDGTLPRAKVIYKTGYGLGDFNR